MLGIRVNKGDSFIEFVQVAYIKSILERFNMENCESVNTSGDASLKLSATCNEDEIIDDKFMERIPYRAAIGCLLYLYERTRPDISHMVTSLSRFNTNYRPTHWRAAKCIFRYLNGTINLKFRYSRTTDNNLIGYTDADWAYDIDKRRSCTGYVFQLSNGAVTWHSGFQQTVTKSTGEAEYMALSDGVAEALSLSYLLKEIDDRQQKPIPIKCDNQSAIQLAETDAYKSRSKHIDIKHHFLRDEISKGNIRVDYIPTEQMVADHLTKSVSAAKHWFYTLNCGLF